MYNITQNMAKTQIKRKYNKRKFNKSKKQRGGDMYDLTQPLPILSPEEITQMGLNTILKLENFVKNTIVNSVKKSVDILINTLRGLIKKMNYLITSEAAVDDFKIAIRQLSIFSMIFLVAMEKPLLKSTDIFTSSAIKFVEGLTAGSIQVLVSIGGAIPFWGAILDMGRAINNSAEMVLNSTQAISTSIGAFKQVMKETKDNINNITSNLDLYPELGISNAINKKFTETANGISQRTNNTINQFQAPLLQSQKVV